MLKDLAKFRVLISLQPTIPNFYSNCFTRCQSDREAGFATKGLRSHLQSAQPQAFALAYLQGSHQQRKRDPSRLISPRRLKSSSYHPREYLIPSRDPQPNHLSNSLITVLFNMTDPLSITSAVLGILGQSIQGIQAVQSLFNQYKIADLTVTATRTECSAIRVALVQIQKLMTNQNLPKHRSGKSKDTDDPMSLTFDEYEAVISACSLTFAVFNQRIEELDVYGVDTNGKSSTKARLKTLWNDDEMNLLRNNIRGQATAITVLLAAFQA